MTQVLINLRLSVAGTVLLCLSAFVAGAADTAGRDSSLEEVIVATRAPVSAEKIGNAVTVLSDKAIAQSQATVVSDLLATTPGVMITRNGGPGSPTSVRIRGAEDTHTLVLIDGVQINDPASPSGGFDFGTLLVGDISRIEILRGSQSTVYGSQAIGGVVSVTTREPQGGLGGDFQAEGGDLKTGLLKAGVGAQFGQASFRVAGSLYRSDGVSAFAGGTETDPFVNATFAGRFNFDFTPDLKLDLRAFYADGKDHYDGFPPPAFDFADEGDYATTRQFVGYAGLNFNLLEGRLANRVAYQSTDTRRLTYLVTGSSETRTGRFDGKNSRVEYQGNVKIADGYDATVGLQHQNETMDSDSAPTHASVTQKSAYAQLQAEVVKGLTFTLGDWLRTRWCAPAGGRASRRRRCTSCSAPTTT
jgi:vitamin B12 transporter